jgi:hypothetical protein
VFNELYTPAHYIPFSREIVLKNSKTAIAYLLSQTEDQRILVDLSSTGKTWERLSSNGFNCNIHAIIYSDAYSYSSSFPIPPKNFTYNVKSSEGLKSNIFLEVFNCADHGRICDIEMINSLVVAKYAKHELVPEMISAIHRPVNTILSKNLFKKYDNLQGELRRLDNDSLLNYIKVIINNICMNATKFPDLMEYEKIDNNYTQYIKALVDK